MSLLLLLLLMMMMMMRCVTEARPCAEGLFRCKTNYRCILSWELCNGRDDCRDNSDEDPSLCPECHPTGTTTAVSLTVYQHINYRLYYIAVPD